MVTRLRLLLTTDAVGGVWRYTMELAAGLLARGWDVRLAVLGPPPSVAQLAEAPVPPVVTGLPLDWTAETQAALADAASLLADMAAGCDVALLHAPALVGDAAWPCPVTVAAHSCVATWWAAMRGGPLPPDLAWRAAATGAGLSRAAAVIAPTRALADALRRAYGLRPINVIHNGRTPPDLPHTRRRGVMTAGRLWDEAKGAAMLDRVAARLGMPFAAAGPTTGPGGQAVVLNHLHGLGPLAPGCMEAALHDVRVFASAARYEPFGLAVLEAAQAGCALVLSDIPSFRELWDGHAVFVPPGDEDAWATALRAAHNDPVPATAHAARYTVDAMADATDAVLRKAA